MMKLIVIFLCLFPVRSFSQNEENIPVRDCAHGHICCDVICPCCPNSWKRIDTATTVKNGVQRMTIIDRSYPRSWDFPIVYHQFRKGTNPWSEKYTQVVSQSFDWQKTEHTYYVRSEAGEYKLLNDMGETVKPTFLSKEKFSENVYVGSVIVSNDRIFCFLDSLGNPLSDLKYCEVQSLNDEGVAVVRDMYGLTGLVDKTGKEVVSCAYGDWVKLGENRYGGRKYRFDLVNTEGFWRILDASGKQLTDSLYWKLGVYSEGKLRASKGRNWVYLDMNGNEVLSVGYDCSDFHGGLAAVSNGKWGFIDSTGTMVIPFQFRYAHDFNDGSAPVAFVNGRDFYWELINEKGHPITNGKYSDIEPFHNGLAYTLRDGKFGGVLNSKGELVVSTTYSIQKDPVRKDWFENGMMISSKKGDPKSLDLIDRNGKLLLDLKQYKSASFAFKNRKLRAFYPYLVVLKEDKTYNVIDFQGNELLTGSYHFVLVVDENIALCRNDSGSYLVNLKTNEVLKQAQDINLNQSPSTYFCVTGKGQLGCSTYCDVKGDMIFRY